MIRKVSFVLVGLFILVWVSGYAPFLGALTKPKLVSLAHVPRADATTPQPQPDSFLYPKLGISTPVQVSSGTSPLDYADWDKIRSALKEGVSLTFPEPRFTDASTIYITGHSSDIEPHAYAFVFAGLGQAAVGDTFSVWVEGKDYRYTVKEKHILAPTDVQGFARLEQAALGTQRALVVTCWPLLTSQKRLVLVAERSL